jgi:hypothetical protein
MLDNVVSPITCVSMNHQNQLEQIANKVMFATERKSSEATIGVRMHPCRYHIRRFQIK